MTEAGVIALGLDEVAQLMPMHVSLSAQGQICSLGPTLGKLLAGRSVLGLDFMQVFEVRRPARVQRTEDLWSNLGQRLHIDLRGSNDNFRGIAVASADGGVLVNLSFGIRVIEAVRQHALTDADFAATDLAVEMLYMVEVKTAVMQELRRLNLRLHGAKLAAEEQALTDTLTGLRNRRAMELHLPRLLSQHIPFGLMHIDLDYFKQVNDTLGHAAGDMVLREVAKALTIETRVSDLVARVGGDEFVVILPGISETDQLNQIARRIIDRVARPIGFEGETCRVSASIGLTISSNYDRPEAEQMLADADLALYASKHAGRAQAQFFAGASGDSLRQK